MRVAFLEAEVPNREHSTFSWAAYMFLQGLVAAGHEPIAVLLLSEHNAVGDETTRRRWIGELEENGIETRVVDASPVAARQRYTRPARIRRLAVPRVEDYAPYVHTREPVRATLRDVHADVVFSWGYEGVAATDGIEATPRFAGVGDPIHLPMSFRREFAWEPRRSRAQRRLDRVEDTRLARTMVKLLSRCDVVGATAAHHAEWFRGQGIAHCRYLHNPVPDWGGPDWRDRRRALTRARPKILLMGHVRGTATLAGIQLLADEVVPELDRLLGDDGYEIHICGKGELPTSLRTTLERPNILQRGFVDDIVHELLDCDVFLVPTPIELGVRVRIAYAWTCGCCVVAHRANACGLPELRHEETGLLAGTGRELARQIVRALDDADARARVSAGGRAVFDERLRQEVVCDEVVQLLEELASGRIPSGVGAGVA